MDGTFFRVQLNYNFWVFHAVLFLLAWNASMFGYASPVLRYNCRLKPFICSILGAVSHDYKVELGYLISQILFLYVFNSSYF